MNIWDLAVLQPMINILIMLTSYLASNFGMAIIVLTVVVNVAMMPLTMKQTKASKSMQEMQPKLIELKKKHEKDRQKLAQEQMRLYKESGMNPVGCLGPMLIQMPIWIALYQSIMMSLAVAPEGLLNLSRYLYSWPVVFSMLPLDHSFLWLNLASPNLILAVLVGGSMWLQQKMATPATADPRQRSQSQMMLWMMPMMFAFLTLSFPSGLALYWVVSNVISIVMQYFITGWGGLVSTPSGRKVTGGKKIKERVARQEETLEADDMGADIVVPSTAQEEELGYGKFGDKRQNRGGGYPERLRTTRRKPGRGGGHRRKRS